MVTIISRVTTKNITQKYVAKEMTKELRMQLLWTHTGPVSYTTPSACNGKTTVTIMALEDTTEHLCLLNVVSSCLPDRAPQTVASILCRVTYPLLGKELLFHVKKRYLGEKKGSFRSCSLTASSIPAISNSGC
jgi:hypothetical protein